MVISQECCFDEHEDCDYEHADPEFDPVAVCGCPCHDLEVEGA